MNQNTKRRWLAALLGAAAGMVVFFLLYGTSTLHPTYDAWILNGYDEWDIQQHYAGWVLFRNSHWAFPLGLADTIAAPDGTVISFTDSIPWVSIFFKALRGVLPSTFQWFGWYTLFCFAMQGAAGALLCARGQAKTGAGALVLSDNMRLGSTVAASGTAQVVSAANSYHREGDTNITQNIYSKAQTAADLQREARWEADKAKARKR